MLEPICLTSPFFIQISLCEYELLVNSCCHVYTLAKVLKRLAMSEDITILTSYNHTSIVKTFSGIDLTEQAFAKGKEFNVTEEPVSDLQSLSKILQRLENNPASTIIRGSLIKAQSCPVPRNKKTFIVTPGQWCMIDIDSLAWKGAVSDQQAMVSYAIQ